MRRLRHDRVSADRTVLIRYLSHEFGDCCDWLVIIINQIIFNECAFLSFKDVFELLNASMHPFKTCAICKLCFDVYSFVLGMAISAKSVHLFKYCINK